MGKDGSPGRKAGESEETRYDYRWSSTPPSTAVVDAVAEASDRDPTAIEPLYEYVDPDSLDSLVRSNGQRSREGATVSFAYADYWVVVRSDGTVSVRSV